MAAAGLAVVGGVGVSAVVLGNTRDRTALPAGVVVASLGEGLTVAEIEEVIDAVGGVVLVALSVVALVVIVEVEAAVGDSLGTAVFVAASLVAVTSTVVVGLAVGGGKGALLATAGAVTALDKGPVMVVCSHSG